MKRILSIVLILSAGTFLAGCDELEDISIDLGGFGGYGRYYDPSPSYYYEEEVWVEEYYVEDSWSWYDSYGW